MPRRSQFETQEEYNEWYKQYREKNREKVRQYNKEYNKIWRKKNGYENESNWKEKNKVKVKAEELLRYAVKMGKIKRKPCIICKEAKTHAHHPDYSKPLEVIFLCALHHKEIHKKGKSELPT